MTEFSNSPELSIVMPCLNEARTLAVCIRKARDFLKKNNVSGEIIVADNGSTDASREIAVKEGARLVEVVEPGYGSALRGGIEAARGLYIVMGDADDSYDFSSLEQFLEKLRDGYELVMGNRFSGGIQSGAMPFLHRYLGNPVLSTLGRIFFHSSVRDFHCGLRAFNKASIEGLSLQTNGMEFASEMVVKATLNNLKMTEVPTVLRRDGRDRAPHLNTWRDGWRHLRFLLLYSPRWLFLYPGLLMSVFGICVLLWLSASPQKLFGITFDIHTMVYASAVTVLGVQATMFALFTKVFAITNKLLPYDDKVIAFISRFTLERGLLLGSFLFLAGIAGSLYSVLSWSQFSFGGLVPTSMMRVVIPSSMAMITGVQVMLAGFFISVLGLIRK